MLIVLRECGKILWKECGESMWRDCGECEESVGSVKGEKRDSVARVLRVWIYSVERV